MFMKVMGPDFRSVSMDNLKKENGWRKVGYAFSCCSDNIQIKALYIMKFDYETTSSDALRYKGIQGIVCCSHKQLSAEGHSKAEWCWADFSPRGLSQSCYSLCAKTHSLFLRSHEGKVWTLFYLPALDIRMHCNIVKNITNEVQVPIIIV